jgi:DNA adenine methylase
MKPLISYYGGKQRMSKNIIPLLPPHVTYIEPFAGGLAVLFAKDRPTNNAKYAEVINDIDDDVINLYRIAKIHPVEFQHEVSTYLCSESLYRKSVEVLNNPKDHSEFERACMYWYNITNSFGNSPSNGFGFRAYDTQKATGSMARKIDGLEILLNRFRQVQIFNTDAIAVIDRMDSPHALFYCDPPYIDTEQKHYSGYTVEHFQNLIRKLDQIQGSFLLSHYESNIDIPTTWEKFEFESDCSINNTGSSKGRKRIEVVYRKISTVPVREDYRKYLWSPTTGQKSNSLF